MSQPGRSFAPVVRIALVLTFHIRDGLKYSDGTPLNAKRFGYSLLRGISPETAGEYTSRCREVLRGRSERSCK